MGSFQDGLRCQGTLFTLSPLQICDRGQADHHQSSALTGGEKWLRKSQEKTHDRKAAAICLFLSHATHIEVQHCKHNKWTLKTAAACSLHVPKSRKKPMPLMFRKVPSRWRWSIKIITFIGHITMRSFLYQRMGYVDILFKSFNGSSAQQVQGSNMWLWCAVGTLPSQSTCESIHRTVRKGLSQSASAVLHE